MAAAFRNIFFINVTTTAVFCANIILTQLQVEKIEIWKN